MLVEVTEEEFHWLCIAVENCKQSAKLISESDDEEDAAEGNYLVVKWSDLERKFPPPDIKFHEPGDG